MPADLGRFNQTLFYRRQARSAELLEDIAAIREFDARQESLIRRWRNTGGVGCLGVVAAIVWLIATRPQHLPAGPLVLLGGGLVIFVVAIITWNLLKKRDLENRRYELAERVLRFLERDTARDGEITLDLDLNRPNTKTKLVRKGKAGRWNVAYYRDPWLRVRGRLLDGTIYSIVLVEKRQDRHRWATSRSGKSKYKSKTKSSTEMVIALKVKARRYPGLAQLSQQMEDMRRAFQRPAWAVIKAIRVQVPEGTDRATVRASTITQKNWVCDANTQTEGDSSGARWFAMAVLSLYQILNMSRVSEGA